VGDLNEVERHLICTFYSGYVMGTNMEISAPEPESPKDAHILAKLPVLIASLACIMVLLHHDSGGAIVHLEDLVDRLLYNALEAAYKREHGELPPVDRQLCIWALLLALQPRVRIEEHPERQRHHRLLIAILPLVLFAFGRLAFGSAHPAS